MAQDPGGSKEAWDRYRMSVVKVIELQPGFQAQPPDWVRMNVMKERVVNNIKEICYSGIFKHPTGALANSIKGYVSGNSIYIISDAPYAKAQEEGVKPHVMWYLLGKTIPMRDFRFGQRRTVYRKATLKSYMRGGWRHPGYEGKHFMQAGIAKGVAEFEDEFSDHNMWVKDM